MRLPHAVWKAYRDELIDKIVNKWKSAAERIVIERLPAIARQVAADQPGQRLDAWPDDITVLIEQLRGDYDVLSHQSREIAHGTFRMVNALSHQQWYAHAKRVLGLDLMSLEPWIQNEAKAWTQENVSLITKLQADTVEDINRVVTSGFRTGKRVKSIRDEILGTDLDKGVFNKVETRAQLIARDQSSKLWGDLNKHRQEEIGVSLYIWRTSDDERVRSTHDNLDDKYCSWDDPTVYADTLEDAIAGRWKQRSSINAYVGFPGEDFQCRCYAEAVFETLFR